MVKSLNPLFSHRATESQRIFSPRRKPKDTKDYNCFPNTCLFNFATFVFRGCFFICVICGHMFWLRRKLLQALRGIALFSSLNSDQFIFDFNLNFADSKAKFRLVAVGLPVARQPPRLPPGMFLACVLTGIPRSPTGQARVPPRTACPKLCQSPCCSSRSVPLSPCRRRAGCRCRP